MHVHECAYRTPQNILRLSSTRKIWPVYDRLTPKIGGISFERLYNVEQALSLDFNTLTMIEFLIEGYTVTGHFYSNDSFGTAKVIIV